MVLGAFRRRLLGSALLLLACSGRSVSHSNGGGTPSGAGVGGALAAGNGPVGGTSTAGGAGGSAGAAGTLGLLPNQCASEQSCANAPTGGCSQCFAPGDFACGGPQRPPADCTSDAECQLTADNLICEAAPCNNAHCIAGCLTAEDCEPSHVCTAHRCAPLACASDADCSANFVCATGACARRACTRSSECDGFCVEGFCHEYAGSCQDACLP